MPDSQRRWIMVGVRRIALWVFLLVVAPGVSCQRQTDEDAAAPPAAVGSITVTPDGFLSAPGSTRQFSALKLNPDGTTEDVTATATWGTSDSSVATLAAGGLATTGGPGGQSVSITASHGGAAGSATLHVALYVYAASNTGNTVTAFSGNPTTGALSAIGSYAAPAASCVVVHPSGLFVYTANPGSGEVSAFSVDPSNGALTLDGSYAVGGPDWGESIAIHPSGRFLYVCDTGTNGVRGFEIDQGTGALTPLAGFPAVAGANYPTSLAVDQTGGYLYATLFIPHQLMGWRIDQDTGALAALPGFPIASVGARPLTVKRHPVRNWMLVAEWWNGCTTYSVDGNSGALTSLSSFGTGGSPRSLGVHPSGGFVYFPKMNAHNLHVFAQDLGTGVLTNTSGSPFFAWPDVQSPAAAVVEPSGRFLYLANGHGVTGYSLDPATGAPTALSGSPFAPPTGLRSVATTP